MRICVFLPFVSFLFSNLLRVASFQRRKMSPGLVRSNRLDFLPEEIKNIVLAQLGILFDKHAAKWVQDTFTAASQGRPDPENAAAVLDHQQNLSLYRLAMQDRQSIGGFPSFDGDDANVAGEIDNDFFWDNGLVEITGGVSATSGRTRDISLVEVSIVNSAPASGLPGPNNKFTLTLCELTTWAYEVGRDEPPRGGRDIEHARLVYLALFETALLFQQEGRVQGPLIHP